MGTVDSESVPKNFPAPTVKPQPAGQSVPVHRRVNALVRVLRSPDLRRIMPILAACAFFANILAVALPLSILQIIDRVVANQSTGTLFFLVTGVLVALVMEEILRSTNGLVTSWLGVRFEHNASVDALTRLMRVPLHRYQQEEPGVHAERVLAASRVADFYSGQALLVLFDLPFTLIFLALIYFLGGPLVLVPVLLLLLFLFLIVHFGDWMRKQVEERSTWDDRRYGFLAEVLSGIHSVKSMIMEALMLRRYERLLGSSADIGEALARGNAISQNLGAAFSQLMIVSVVFASSWQVMEGVMSPGSLAACMMLSIRALQPVRRTLTVWMRYQSFVTAQARLDEIYDMPFENDTGKPAMEPVRDHLALLNISLAYGGATTIFSDLSLRVEANHFVVIRGESGSGKSSLMSLMNGLVRPNSGEVVVDGLPLDNFSVDSVHQQIALLPQTGTIIAGNILENLTMFDSTLNQTALKLSRELGLDRIVAGMKLGYETSLGEGLGETLPAGVRQLISIVRALVHNPSVILFDEANISLDMRGDQLLRDFFAKRKGSCTIIMVTHRPSLISLADRVYHLAGGKIVEEVKEQSAAGNRLGAETPEQPLTERPENREEITDIVRRQFEEESDLAICLPYLLNALSWGGQPRELAESMPHMMPRMELSDLCSTLANLGFFPKQLESSPARLDHRLTPCLFVPPARCAMVLLRYLADGRVVAFDSATRAEAEIEPPHEMGGVYLFRKPEVVGKKKGNEPGWLSSMLMRFRFHILLGFLLSVFGAMLSLTPPLFVRAVYNSVLPSSDIKMGAFLLLGALMAISINIFVVHLKGRAMAFVSGRTEYMLGSTIFKKVIALPTASIEGASISNQVGRIKNLESLRDFFLGPLALVAFELPAGLVLLIALGIINPWSLVVVLLAVIAYTTLGYFSRKYSEMSTGPQSNLTANRWEFLNETLTDMRFIRLAGVGASWINRFREMSGKAVMANFRSKKMNSRVNGISRIIGSCTGLLVLALSAYLSIIGKIGSGTMLATMLIIWRLIAPIQNIFTGITALVRTQSNLRQIENLTKLKGEADTGVAQTIRPNTHGTLNFTRVSFRYVNDSDPALLGVTFAVEPGRLVVIAGGNGSGKSTVLKLIERLYIPQAGTIRINNVDIRQLTTNDLRAKISYMPQKCEVFYGTIAQNLRLVHPIATDAELEWAIEMAGLGDDIRALRQRLGTRIAGSRSEQLPHGFRQRLSLARAMLKPAELVLLDEPGTGMDQSGEEALLRCLRWLRGRATTIVVSHRPGHMRLADTVIVMERGSVAAKGKFEDVKEKVMAGTR